ncbi:hypothetical protein M899_2632 [Bacteriovorax sp. BSW11_IV]|uniref:hypothetical protein n=1 Tax=Bacteriovorax sp. BSW11_IV TaxID=1353529 RepID=UPI00038A0837|nr:hypothetical protein [Bacteriovorax sp. BSW11_IV]EQC49860.1 hypothetical protein M899_2632 [Bacteriovorax sp. BSW11_IV]
MGLTRRTIQTFLILTLSTPLAFASNCPQIAGWYQCETSKNKYEINVIQHDLEEHSEFDIHIVDEVDYEFITDNKGHNFPDNKFLRKMWYVARCEGNSLHTYVEGKAYLAGVKVGKAKLNVQVTPSEKGGIVKVNGRFGLVKLNEVKECKRIEKP